MTLRTIRYLTALASLVAGVANAQIEIEFRSESAADEWDARTYRAIWAEYGERIVAALEIRTCLPFPETRVGATVAEAVSNSGGPEHPMRLRASYIRNVKQSTLVHELGHRHLWQLAERLEDVDGHMTLYLVLDRVWADVWGEEFALDRVLDESHWDQDYAEAWSWARALKPEQRSELWNELLTMNGVQGGCDSLLGDA
ncbi:MAG TPA: hypothetical protein VLD39_05655 [Gammaproteobacteria bacterium]|nr:hypothetical protein [Gammaproteobacteria bacterium]